MTPDGFEAIFRVRIDRRTAWRRLTEGAASLDEGEHMWLPGFDSQVTVVDTDPEARLQTRKDDEPCAGTDIVVTLEDDEIGVRIRVVQSRFGAWLPDRYGMMSVGWRYIVADLQTYLATGVHARRHLRAWGDLGADAVTVDGALRVERINDGGLANRLGLVDGDLLVSLGGAPLASLDDLVTVLRTLDTTTTPTGEWIRSGEMLTTPGSSPDPEPRP
jgi:hypothetical protein